MADADDDVPAGFTTKMGGGAAAALGEKPKEEAGADELAEKLEAGAKVRLCVRVLCVCVCCVLCAAYCVRMLASVALLADWRWGFMQGPVPAGANQARTCTNMHTHIHTLAVYTHIHPPPPRLSLVRTSLTPRT